uniref:Uncharacterized protein n=1 Tax=Candidatus Kentrum sp. MB TaxID=2138164 RepID=A0A450XPQ7_9GAMM|nr:MAG: hypothetical protein BECKMB1821G_GA0114241_10818 [Candidatus Kentron sp. MB]
MIKNSDFHSVAFFRKTRDQHAKLLSNKTPKEIIAFFGRKNAPGKPISWSCHATKETESSQGECFAQTISCVGNIPDESTEN